MVYDFDWIMVTSDWQKTPMDPVEEKDEDDAVVWEDQEQRGVNAMKFAFGVGIGNGMFAEAMSVAVPRVNK